LEGVNEGVRRGWARGQRKGGSERRGGDGGGVVEVDWEGGAEGGRQDERGGC